MNPEQMPPHRHEKFVISDAQAEEFHRYGVVLAGPIAATETVAGLRKSFERLFRGEFETGTMPDEVNWREGKSDPSLARQICNGWRADRTVARTVLREDCAEAVAKLMGWDGVRIMHDNVLWKPAGTRSFNYHQDNAYLRWFDPGEICSLWVALDDVAAQNGAMELVRGSHRWPLAEPEGTFHGPADYQAPMRKQAASLGVDPDIVHITVPAGSGSIHHGGIWHGSGPNNGDTPRRSLVIHAMPADSRYRRAGFGKGNGPIYSRYARMQSDELDENYFPILWRSDGYRSAGLEEYCASRH